MHVWGVCVCPCVRVSVCTRVLCDGRDAADAVNPGETITQRPPCPRPCHRLIQTHTHCAPAEFSLVYDFLQRKHSLAFFIKKPVSAAVVQSPRRPPLRPCESCAEPLPRKSSASIQRKVEEHYKGASLPRARLGIVELWAGTRRVGREASADGAIPSWRSLSSVAASDTVTVTVTVTEAVRAWEPALPAAGVTASAAANPAAARTRPVWERLPGGPQAVITAPPSMSQEVFYSRI